MKLHICFYHVRNLARKIFREEVWFSGVPLILSVFLCTSGFYNRNGFVEVGFGLNLENPLHKPVRVPIFFKDNRLTMGCLRAK